MSLLEQVKSAIAAVEPGADIVLYGSRARNDYHEGSDWDFVVLVDGVIDYRRVDIIRRALFEVECETGEVLSSIVRSKGLLSEGASDFVPLHESIRRDGRRI